MYKKKIPKFLDYVKTTILNIIKKNCEIESLPTAIFFNGKIYYIYKGIKSQVLHKKRK